MKNEEIENSMFHVCNSKRDNEYTLFQVITEQGTKQITVGGPMEQDQAADVFAAMINAQSDGQGIDTKRNV
jgi:hypothetical protein